MIKKIFNYLVHELNKFKNHDLIFSSYITYKSFPLDPIYAVLYIY